MPYEGSEAEWVDSSSSVRSDMPHRYLYNQHRPQPQQHQPPTADIDLFNSLHDDIHNSGRYLLCTPSTGSLVALLESKRVRVPRGVTATPTPSLPGSGLQSPTAFLSSNDLSAETLVNQQQQRHVPYPAWTDIDDLPSYQNIQDIFIDLKNAFGFQYDSMLNMLDHFMVMLDSRASRMTPAMALLTLHADYIGGPNANYRKWYFAAQLNLDDAVGDKNAVINVAEDDAQPQPHTLTKAEEDWRCKMENMTDNERVRQLALWLMIWGEASVIRFCPEVLCFIFKLADDACKDRLSLIHQPQKIAAEGEYLDKIITPLYGFVKDQVYRKDKYSNFVRRDRYHDSVIGYGDVNQFFWYPETISKLQLQDKTKPVSIAAHQRYDLLQHVNWKKAFQKTSKEKRFWMHLAVNFTRIWIIHIVPF